MPRPFSQFSKTDLANLERELDNLSVDELSTKLPSCKRPDIRNDYAVLEYSRLPLATYDEYLAALPNPIISMIINNRFDVTVIGLNNADAQLCKQKIEEYLVANQFK